MRIALDVPEIDLAALRLVLWRDEGAADHCGTLDEQQCGVIADELR